MGSPHRCKSGMLPAAMVLLVAGIAVLGGCHPPKAVPSYEFITRYDRMSEEHDPLVSLVYVPEARRLGEYDGVVIGDVGVGETWVESKEEASGYARLFRIVLQKELRKLDRFGFVTLDAESYYASPEHGPALLMEGLITRFDTGSGWKRYFSYYLWFLQSGATDFQIEGRLVDAESGELVMEFVDRRRGIYNTAFGPYHRTFQDKFAMCLTARDTAQCLAAFMGEGYEGIPAIAAADATAKQDDRL